MNTRSLAFIGVLLAVGTVLHAVMASFFGGMKMDLLLTMMFLGIILFPQVKNVAILALGTGVISALTTTFPGGQLANIIDKPITATVFFLLFLLVKKYINTKISVIILTAIGTIVSGSIFLYVALMTVGGLPAPFPALFTVVVLPTAMANSIIMAVLYPVVQSIARRSSLAID